MGTNLEMKNNFRSPATGVDGSPELHSLLSEKRRKACSKNFLSYHPGQDKREAMTGLTVRASRGVAPALHANDDGSTAAEGRTGGKSSSKVRVPGYTVAAGRREG